MNTEFPKGISLKAVPYVRANPREPVAAQTHENRS